MKKIKNFIKSSLLAIILLVFIYCGTTSAANVITANLKASPINALPGTTIKFQTTIFSNPDFYAKPGDKIQVVVTRDDFSWISEKLNVTYPGIVTGILNVNFTEKFTIPSDAKAGQVFKFALTNKLWWPMSELITIKVIGLQKKKDYIRKIKKIPPPPKEKTLKKVPTIK